MALNATIYKAALQISDMDRHVYREHALTLARHPSETEERLMVRLLAFALNVPHDTEHGALQFARGLSDADEPDLWQHDLTGQLVQWIEVGQPDERRLAGHRGARRRQARDSQRGRRAVADLRARAGARRGTGLARRSGHVDRPGNLAVKIVRAAHHGQDIAFLGV